MPVVHAFSVSFLPPAMVSAPVLLLAIACATLTASRDVDNEASEAAITDPEEECTPYYYAPSADMHASFPAIWQTADIVPDDDEAQSKFDSIAASIPASIQPKGTHTGDFSGVTYTSEDPDCWWTWSRCTTPKLSGLPSDIINIPEPKSLGIGFDDGPNCSHNAFYDYLAEQEQKATMFYIGSNVFNWPLEAQRGVVDGHQVCVHTWAHQYMTSLSNQQAFAELYYTIKAIKLVTGVTPACWRPPFGDVDDRIRAIANGLGLETIVWTYDSDDWKVGQGGVTEETIDGNYQNLVDRVNDGTLDTVGTIILTHELNNFTMQKAVEWYPRLKEAFTAVVPIAVALNQTTPYAETDHTFPTFDDYVGNAASSSSASQASTSTIHTATGTGSASQASGGSDKAPTSSSAGQSSAKSNGATKTSPTWTSMWLAGAAAMFFAYY